jgi:hypothetical protein
MTAVRFVGRRQRSCFLGQPSCFRRQRSDFLEQRQRSCRLCVFLWFRVYGEYTGFFFGVRTDIGALPHACTTFLKARVRGRAKTLAITAVIGIEKKISGSPVTGEQKLPKKAIHGEPELPTNNWNVKLDIAEIISAPDCGPGTKQLTIIADQLS